MKYLALLPVLILCAAAAEPHSPPAGSPERQAILDSLRPPLNKLAGRKVKFVYPTIQVRDGWAKVSSEFVSEDGKLVGSDLGDEFTFDYLGLAQRVRGKWEIRYWGFSGDIGTVIEARRLYPAAPSDLFPEYADKILAEDKALISKGKAERVAAGVFTPKVGSKERKAIMDALRIPVQAKVKQDVVFRVEILHVARGWAFFQGSAVRPEGSILGEEHAWGDVMAVLREKDGQWAVLHWTADSSHYSFPELREKFPDAPPALIP